jgi:hypothetical protein
MSTENRSIPNGSLLKSYSAAAVIIGSAVAWVVAVVTRTPRAATSEALIMPMVALFTVTVLVWLTMLVVRNTAVIRGRASVRYYEDYQSSVPDERIERPARTFNNLMQVPTLFYVACILMLVTKQADEAQVMLAWTFVALRGLHALVYMVLNWVPYRFAVWTSSFITLCVIWFRFAVHVPLG